MDDTNHISNKFCVEGGAYLRDADPIMAQLISKHGNSPFSGWEYRPFDSLVRSIISQQLSAKAADSIEHRLSKVVSTPFFPNDFLSVSIDNLRGAGLSAAKTRYILELAKCVLGGDLIFSDLFDKSDEEVIETLVKVPGIGRWTAEMFLIFGLLRPDVLALGDAGLQRAVRLLYGERADLSRVGKNWKPYRSVASWYLWKHLDS